MKKNGIIALVPLFIIAAVLVLGFTIASFKKGGIAENMTNVLSVSVEDRGKPSDADRPDKGKKSDEEPATKSDLTITQDEEKFKVKQKEFEAESDFPLSVDSETGHLSVTTPKGRRVVTTLPDQAAEKIPTSEGTPTQIQLTADISGNPYYEIEATKYKKLLGIFSIPIGTTALVSGQSGQVTNMSQTIVSRILDFFSR